MGGGARHAAAHPGPAGAPWLERFISRGARQPPVEAVCRMVVVAISMLSR